MRLILVPGVGKSPSVDTWGFQNGPWNDQLSLEENRVHVAGHYPVVDDETKFSVQQLIETGAKLSEVLEDLGRKNAAFSMLQAKNRIRTISLIKGIVFIGCPHGIGHRDVLKENCAFLLQQCLPGRSIKKLLEIRNWEDKMLEVSEEFAKWSFHFPILSIYEGRPTLKKSFIQSKHKTTDQPAPNRDFFGREGVMEELDSVLLPGHQSGEKTDSSSVPSIAALFGVAGLGKTQVASHYAYTRSHKFEAVFWISAEDTDKLEVDFCNIATRIGLVSEKEPHNPNSTKELVRSWLSKPTRTVGGKSDIDQGSPPKWLLVFDNADRPGILEDYVDIEGPGSILVTSRDPQVCNVSSNIVAVDLPPFTEEEALGFFKKSSRQSFKTEKDY
ncbi:tetratricopeptide repeat domain-containing protein [Colletotrichum musicola]|uniref:Tetratricopeptide repeat domain-containing protein n=1 Tax=Colletotrichum musicola TaxID=2175873 RepID=A0A8H6U8H8_9PEZI|nr:tetratricopeptide repeat domain-containing protein [Colletotrichum musicola]